MDRPDCAGLAGNEDAGSRKLVFISRMGRDRLYLLALADLGRALAHAPQSGFAVFAGCLARGAHRPRNNPCRSAF